eukprot:gene19549-23378_t
MSDLAEPVDTGDGTAATGFQAIWSAVTLQMYAVLFHVPLFLALCVSKEIREHIYMPKLFRNEKPPDDIDRFRKRIVEGPGPWAFIRHLWKVKEEEVLKMCGLDAIVLLRIARLGVIWSARAMLFDLFVVLPINANEMNERVDEYSDFDRFTIVNVPDASWKLMAHLISALLHATSLLQLLWENTKYIHDLKRKENGLLRTRAKQPDDFTVLITFCLDPSKGLELDMREFEHEVKEKFKLFFKTDDIEDHLLRTGSNFSGIAEVLKLFPCDGPYRVVNIVQVVDPTPGEELLKEERELASCLANSLIRYRDGGQKHRPKIQLGFMGMLGDEVDAMTHYLKELHRVRQELRHLQTNEGMDSLERRDAFFVSFETEEMARTVAQLQLKEDTNTFLVETAPASTNIYWHNLGKLSLASKR